MTETREETVEEVVKNSRRARKDNPDNSQKTIQDGITIFGIVHPFTFAIGSDNARRAPSNAITG